MSQLQDRIVQFRKMASDDPDNELGHFRLGQLLMEAEQLDDAIASFRRTLDLSPQFSKVYQLLGGCLIKGHRQAEAIELLTRGYAVADERGDNIPRDEMAKMLAELGKPVAPSTRTAPTGGAGFRCARPGCQAGAAHAHPLPSPPMNDALGKRIQQTICADCWNEWLRNFSIKVINELRLDLSDERGQAEYDRHMMMFLGFEE